jgi:hypothetical protein
MIAGDLADESSVSQPARTTRVAVANAERSIP